MMHTEYQVVRCKNSVQSPQWSQNCPISGEGEVVTIMSNTFEIQYMWYIKYE